MSIWLFFNYVGCKYVFKFNNYSGHFRLFFNYVGCKLLNSLRAPLSLISCSLTMWDVNLLSLKLCVAKARLFFNYVGCKSSMPFCLSTAKAGCSLTMWDVNFIVKYGTNLSFVCCSLTMWDVNEIFLRIPGQELSVVL